MSLTTKELFLIQDNIKMAQNYMQFTQSCVDQLQDPEIRNLCQDIIAEYRGSITTLTSHINKAQVQ